MLKKVSIICILILSLMLFSGTPMGAQISYGSTVSNIKKPTQNSLATIAIYGDSRSNDKVHKKIIDKLVKMKPVAVFHTGDLVGDGNDKKLWIGFDKMIAPLLKVATFYSAPGNHENESKLYYNNFNFPNNEKWYSVNIKNAHFISLDSNLSLKKDSEQYRWLENDLKSVYKNGKFIVIIMHHPLFSVGVTNAVELKEKNDLIALFDKYKVDAIFAGHVHNYERFNFHNINYIITGGGGAPLYNRIRDNKYLRSFTRTYNYCKLTFYTNKLNITAYDLNDHVLDSFVVNKK